MLNLWCGLTQLQLILLTIKIRKMVAAQDNEYKVLGMGALLGSGCV